CTSCGIIYQALDIFVQHKKPQPRLGCFMLREMNLAQFHFLKDQLIAFSPNDNGITRVKFPRKNTLCQTIFNTLLNGTFQWTRTIQWIEASLDQLIESTVIDRQTHIAFCQTLTQAVQLDIGNTANL